jgi:thiol:disulfide interchange protein DsbD
VFRRMIAAAALVLCLARPAHAQLGGSEVPPAEKLVHATAAPVTIAAGGAADVRVQLAIQAGWHVNANPPAMEYNIPTQVSIAPAGGLAAGAPRYPKGTEKKFGFEEKPLLVYDSVALVVLPLRAAAGAATGAQTLHGTVEFQACNDEVCLPPAKVPFDVAVTVTAAGANVTPPPVPDAATFATSAPAGGAPATGVKGRLASALAQGGIFWILFLFVTGLGLNLTPCVFPMLGITVSIFGVRRKEPLPKVVATAVIYVLGICVTYTALGVVAGLTGSLFGSALQNVWVDLALGAIMLVLSLGMFGVYEMQPPAWVMNRLGGAQATNFAGAFVSGLGVGIIAAPCVGPVVVLLLALIAQHGSVGFGVRTMFTLSLGLGAPYLVLATFSNLLQMLPRSGDWMTWVKHLFGTIMVGTGLYYVCLGLFPGFVPWVVPVTMFAGGLWLGVLDPSIRGAGTFLKFARLAALLAMIAGVKSGYALQQAQARTLPFQSYDPAAVAASVAAGRPVMLDFSADWCAPCHELELVTFADSKVVAAARHFDRYHVDLTKFDAPASEASRKQYAIRGVPTIVFLGKDGREIADTRVEGFLAPEKFLALMARGNP